VFTGLPLVLVTSIVDTHRAVLLCHAGSLLLGHLAVFLSGLRVGLQEGRRWSKHRDAGIFFLPWRGLGASLWLPSSSAYTPETDIGEATVRISYGILLEWVNSSGSIHYPPEGSPSYPDEVRHGCGEAIPEPQILH
jgi:hypothetical protein